MKNKLTTTVIALLISLSSQAGGGFSLWQLASQADKIGNSYVMRTDKGRVVVIDGGYAEEAPYLRGFIAALGGKVDMWIITHPHPDHSGALTEILKKDGVELWGDVVALLGAGDDSVFHSLTSNPSKRMAFPRTNL